MSNQKSGAHVAPILVSYDVEYTVGGVASGGGRFDVFTVGGCARCAIVTTIAAELHCDAKDVELTSFGPADGPAPAREPLAAAAAKNRAARGEALPQFIREMDEVLAPAAAAQAQAEHDEAAYRQHQDGARLDLHAIYRDLLADIADVGIAWRMTKLAALQMVRDAGKTTDERYLLARTLGVVAGLAEVETEVGR